MCRLDSVLEPEFECPWFILEVSQAALVEEVGKRDREVIENDMGCIHE